METQRTPLTKHTESAEKEAEHLIVEVGCGGYPHLWTFSDDHKQLIKNDESVRYIGIDIDEEDLRSGKRGAEARADTSGLPGERMHFVRADGEKLPLKDAVVSELIIRNVLGDPETHELSKLWMLDEAARVLKIGGILTISEQYTPKVALRQYLVSRIDHLTKNVPLQIVDDADRSPHEMESDMKLYNDSASDESSFVLRLRKLPPTAPRT